MAMAATTWAIVRDSDQFVVLEGYTRRDVNAAIDAGFVSTCGDLLWGRDAWSIVKLTDEPDECDGCDGCDEDYAVAYGTCDICGRPIGKHFFG